MYPVAPAGIVSLNPATIGAGSAKGFVSPVPIELKYSSIAASTSDTWASVGPTMLKSDDVLPLVRHRIGARLHPRRAR